MTAHDSERKPKQAAGDAKPPHGQGHQPLPGEQPSPGGEARRKHVQNADLPPGQGHQPLPGEDPPAKDKDRD